SIFTPPSYCPVSFSDARFTHSHGPLNSALVYDTSGSIWGIWDETGNVFGSADIAVRLNPTDSSNGFSTDPKAGRKGYIDAWLFRNVAGRVVRDPTNALQFSGPTPINNGPSSPCSGNYVDGRSGAGYQSTAVAVDACVPAALRQTTQPA